MNPKAELGSEGDVHPSPLKVERADLVVALVLVAICAVLYYDTTTWPSVPASLSQNAPPTVFPRLLIGLIFILTLGIPFERNWKRRSGEGDTIGYFGWPRPVMFATGAFITLAVYLMPILGILPVMFAAAAILPILWGERRYGIVAIFAIALPIAVALLFAAGLQVNLAFGLTGDVFRFLR